MKCMPITLSGRRVRAAMAVMLIELVLLARMELEVSFTYALSVILFYKEY